MRSKFLFPVILSAGLMLVNFSVSQVYGQVPQDKVANPLAKKYTCPMHPEVVQDKPGNCPKCNAMLVEKVDVPMGVKRQKVDTTIMKKRQKIDTTATKNDMMK